MDTMLTYNTNSKTGPVCGGKAISLRKDTILFFSSNDLVANDIQISPGVCQRSTGTIIYKYCYIDQRFSFPTFP